MDAVLIVLLIVVALVAIDAIAKLDERRPSKSRKRDPSITTTQKIVVDLTDRDLE